MSDLDSILSGQGEAVSETPEKEQVTATEGESQQEQPEASTQEGDETGGQKTVPHAALHAERQKVKRYTEEVAEFRRANETLSRQVTELLQRVPVPKVEQPPKPDIFENPDQFVRQSVGEFVNPLEQKFGQFIEHFSKSNAIKAHGEDGLTEAFRALDQAALSGNPEAIRTVSAVKQSMDPYGDIVSWHKRQKAQAEIGDDPAAYKAKLEAEIREKLLAEINGGEQQQAKPTPVMPSNIAGARNVGARSGPAWSGPAPLQDIFNRSRAS